MSGYGSDKEIQQTEKMVNDRYMESVGADSVHDGKYMQREIGDEENLQGDWSGMQKESSESVFPQDGAEQQNAGSVFADEADSVHGFNTENAQEGHQHTDAEDSESSGNGTGGPPAALHRAKTRFFSDKISNQRMLYLRTFWEKVLQLGCLAIVVFSIYWGALYNHSSHYGNIKFIAVVLDDGFMNHGIQASITDSLGHFSVFDNKTFTEKFGPFDGTIEDHVHKLVHEKKYWGSFIANGASDALLSSLRSTQSNDPGFNSTAHFEFFYESARDLSNFRSSILPLLTSVESIFTQEFYYPTYLPEALKNNTDATPEHVASAGNMQWAQIDYRPFDNPTLLAPMQVGLIYCILLTFFQLALFGPTHGMLAALLKPKHILIYRLINSWIIYFFLSLFFCMVSAIFQVNFNPAFGKGGFVVYWMTTYLLMGAVGGANENVLSLLLAYQPTYLGFWLMSWIILNVSPSFVSMALLNRFYRYGYMMPVYNALEIYRVIFLNTYKGTMGRNYGILVVWCVINTVLFPFIMKIVGAKYAKDARKK